MVALSTHASALATVLPFLITAATAQSSGTFDFLTYNVAGLPAFLSGNGIPGDKGTNANSIGAQLAAGDYDIVHMQEVRREIMSLRTHADGTGLQLSRIYLRNGRSSVPHRHKWWSPLWQWPEHRCQLQLEHVPAGQMGQLLHQRGRLLDAKGLLIHAHADCRWCRGRPLQPPCRRWVSSHRANSHRN
jgi:hypothetical protein